MLRQLRALTLFPFSVYYVLQEASVAKEKKTGVVIVAILLFVLYVFIASQPIPQETVLVSAWLKNLDSALSEEEAKPAPEGFALPFVLGNRFGYADSAGNLVINKIKEQYVSISDQYWSEYEPAPQELVIQNPAGEELTRIPARGYPVFLDGRIFIAGREQSSLTELDSGGNPLWSYNFEAPLTSIDVAGGYVLAGTLDGSIELLDSTGTTVFPSYVPAARITVVQGCRISSDGSKIALVAGIDEQRFIFLERYGSKDYRVTYHEVLQGEALRREIHIAFINNGSAVVFEHPWGLGIFDVKTRTRYTLPLNGKLEAIDTSGVDDLFFCITSGKKENEKRFIALRLPDTVLIDAPFSSEHVFLSRRKNNLFVGGGLTLASFVLDRM